MTGSGLRVVARKKRLEVRDRAETLRIAIPPWSRPNGIADLTLASALQRHVSMVLDYCEGSVHWAAHEMGIDPSTLYRWRLTLERGDPLDYGSRGIRE
jgi:hypothetical protein